MSDFKMTQEELISSYVNEYKIILASLRCYDKEYFDYLKTYFIGLIPVCGHLYLVLIKNILVAIGYREKFSNVRNFDFQTFEKKNDIYSEISREINIAVDDTVKILQTEVDLTIILKYKLMIKLLKNIKVNNYKKKIEKNVINIIIVMYQIKLEGDTYSNICKQEFYNLLLNEEYSKKNTEILIEELVFVLNTNHLVENLIKEFI